MGLPRPVLVLRLNNEIGNLNKYLGARIPPLPENAEFPLKLEITLRNHPAKTSETDVGSTHSLEVVVSEEYPFQRPGVRWLTPIFHPNIKSPEDGGDVCVKNLSDWSFGASLVSFIKAVEVLITEPNPLNPYPTDSCMRASKWLMENDRNIDVKVGFGDENA